MEHFRQPNFWERTKDKLAHELKQLDTLSFLASLATLAFTPYKLLGALGTLGSAVLLARRNSTQVKIS